MSAVTSGLVAMALAMLVVALVIESGLLGRKARRLRTSSALATATLALLLAAVAVEQGPSMLPTAIALTAAILIGCWAMWRGLADRRGIMVAAVGGFLALAALGAGQLLATEQSLALSPGTSRSFQGWTVQLRGVRPAVGPDWSGVAADLVIRRHGDLGDLSPARETRLRPERTGNPLVTLERWDGVLSARLGPEQGREVWPVELGWRPFVSLIPIGAMIAVLGILLALLGRPIAIRWRARRMARAGQWWG